MALRKKVMCQHSCNVVVVVVAVFFFRFCCCFFVDGFCLGLVSTKRPIPEVF